MEENKNIEEKKVTNTEVTEKKKGKGCLIGCLIFLAILILLVVAIAGVGYWGYKKIEKGMIQEDLGITYSQQDYFDLMDDIGLDAEPNMLCIDCSTPTFSDPHEVSVIVTDQQASAGFEYINQELSYGSISGTQIDIKDGNAILTTNFTFEGKEFPIYMVGTISKASENSITGNISELRVGVLKIPQSISKLAESKLLNIANEKIASANDTVRIDTLELTDSGVVFEGLIPGKAE